MIIDTDKVMTAIEIAESAGVTPGAVTNWMTREAIDFPEPIVELRIGRLWDRDEIEQWLAQKAATKSAQTQKRIEYHERMLKELRGL